jgi:hypothetical protein
MTLRPPIVTDVDRQWALDQCPTWAVRATAAPDWLDNNRDATPVWDEFVSGEIERFEKFFLAERKTYGEWSRLWRQSWWPKSEPHRRIKSAPPPQPGAYPVYRRGSAEFAMARQLATPAARAVMDKIGLVMFRPDDPMVAAIQEKLTARSRAMTGEAAE